MLHFGLRWAHARVSGAGGAAGMGMDQAATRGHGLDRPAGGPSLLSARHRCPLAAKVLPVSRSVGTRMVHTANFAGIGKGRRPQATCQREECEPFGVIPNYVINYLIVLIFINRVPFPLAAALQRSMTQLPDGGERAQTRRMRRHFGATSGYKRLHAVTRGYNIQVMVWSFPDKSILSFFFFFPKRPSGVC